MLAVSRRWSEPEAAYRRWHRERAGNDFGLGAVQVVQVERMVWVANMVGQHGIRTGSKGVPVRYEAIDTALGALAGRAAELGGVRAHAAYRLRAGRGTVGAGRAVGGGAADGQGDSGDGVRPRLSQAAEWQDPPGAPPADP